MIFYSAATVRSCILHIPSANSNVTHLCINIHNAMNKKQIKYMNRPIGWRKAHPAGAHWIDWYDGRDATEVMDAFHSEKARGMWQKLPKSSPEAVEVLSKQVADDSSTQIAFRELRDQLEADGWWERDFVHEAKLLTIWVGLVAGAAATAHTVAPLSTFLLSLAMTNAGWLGHDYVHGVDKFCDRMRNFVCFGAGLGTTWWSDKVRF